MRGSHGLRCVLFSWSVYYPSVVISLVVVLKWGVTDERCVARYQKPPQLIGPFGVKIFFRLHIKLRLQISLSKETYACTINLSLHVIYFAGSPCWSTNHVINYPMFLLDSVLICRLCIFTVFNVYRVSLTPSEWWCVDGLILIPSSPGPEIILHCSVLVYQTLCSMYCAVWCSVWCADIWCMVVIRDNWYVRLLLGRC